MIRRTFPATPSPLSGRLLPDNFFRGRFGDRLWLAAAVLVAGSHASHVDAQEVPRPSYARQVEKKALPTIANFKVGEVLLRVDASVTTTFVDNVDSTQNGKADVIFAPQVGINATWAMTKLNTLQFRAGLGYMYYVNHPNLNRQTTTITPDSALTFNVYAGDVKISFHDQFGLQQETTSQGTLSGLAQIERFTNTAGFSVLWDTNDVIWNFGYDHFNFISLGGANSSSGAAASYSQLDHSTDQISASIATKIGPSVIAGIEGTVSYSDYPKQTASNFTSITTGPYVEVQLTKYTHMFLSGGFKGYYSGANAPGSVSVGTAAAQPATGDPTGFYANLSLVHKMNRYYSDQLTMSHADDVEGLSGHTQSNSVRYTGTWLMNRKMSLSTSLFYEDVRVLSGSALSGSGGVASNFNRFGGSLSTSYPLTERVGVSFGYQYLKKQAVRATESYTQNSVTFSLGYRF